MQTEVDIQFKLELLGILNAEQGYKSAEVHRHPFFEIFCIAEGAFEVHLDQHCETVSTGEVFVISPELPHADRMLSALKEELEYLDGCYAYAIKKKG